MGFSAYFVLVLFALRVSSQDPIVLMSQNTQSGQATYYGGSVNAGACSINPVPNFVQTAFNAGTLMPAALNAAQYASGDKSKACGLCLVLNETGTGSGGNPVKGPMLVWIKDVCPECAVADIDLGTNGDGRWGVVWKAVNCPVGSEKLSYIFQGSHTYYLKMQVRGHTVPVLSLEYQTPSGTWIAGSRTADNFYECPGYPYPVKLPLNIRVTSVTNEVVLDSVPAITANLVTQTGTNQVQFVGFSGGTPPATPSPVAATKAPTAPTKAPTSPTSAPTFNPTNNPTPFPTANPTATPTAFPTPAPTTPTQAPTQYPLGTPTLPPSNAPSLSPSAAPTPFPTQAPTSVPTPFPTPSGGGAPTAPTEATSAPTEAPVAVCRTLENISITLNTNEASILVKWNVDSQVQLLDLVITNLNPCSVIDENMNCSVDVNMPHLSLMSPNELDAICQAIQKELDADFGQSPCWRFTCQLSSKKRQASATVAFSLAPYQPSSQGWIAAVVIVVLLALAAIVIIIVIMIKKRNSSGEVEKY